MAIHGCDYMGIYDLLSPEEKMVQESVSDFVDNEVLPIIEKHYQAGTFPVRVRVRRPCRNSPRSPAFRAR